MKKIIILSLLSVTLALGLGGCDRRTMGAGAGAAVGGTVGALAGGTTGAVIGGVAGAVVGSHLTKDHHGYRRRVCRWRHGHRRCWYTYSH